jgi:hypothetical protein
MRTEPDASVVGRRTSNLTLHSREGYEVREGEIKPDTRGENYVHDRDARLFVLDGRLTLVPLHSDFDRLPTIVILGCQA